MLKHFAALSLAALSLALLPGNARSQIIVPDPSESLVLIYCPVPPAAGGPRWCLYIPESEYETLWQYFEHESLCGPAPGLGLVPQYQDMCPPPKAKVEPEGSDVDLPESVGDVDHPTAY